MSQGFVYKWTKQPVFHSSITDERSYLYFRNERSDLCPNNKYQPSISSKHSVRWYGDSQYQQQHSSLVVTHKYCYFCNISGDFVIKFHDNTEF